jgi:hypothetical protein
MDSLYAVCDCIATHSSAAHGNRFRNLGRWSPWRDAPAPNPQVLPTAFPAQVNPITYAETSARRVGPAGREPTRSAFVTNLFRFARLFRATSIFCKQEWLAHWRATPSLLCQMSRTGGSVSWIAMRGELIRRSMPRRCSNASVSSSISCSRASRISNFSWTQKPARYGLGRRKFWRQVRYPK